MGDLHERARHRRPVGPGGHGVMITGDIGPSSPQFQSAQRACAKFLPGGGPPQLTPAQKAERARALAALAACMRKHGVSKFPDPNGQGGFRPEPGGARPRLAACSRPRTRRAGRSTRRSGRRSGSVRPAARTALDLVSCGFLGGARARGSRFAAGCGGASPPGVANLGRDRPTTTPRRRRPGRRSADPRAGVGRREAQPGINVRDGAKFAACMRAHGVPNFPDPSSPGAIQLGPSSGLDPSRPSSRRPRRRAGRRCRTAVGRHLAAGSSCSRERSPSPRACASTACRTSPTRSSRTGARVEDHESRRRPGAISTRSRAGSRPRRRPVRGTSRKP